MNRTRIIIEFDSEETPEEDLRALTQGDFDISDLIYLNDEHMPFATITAEKVS